MSARILVVDDEPDLAALIRQRFRRQIREGEMTFEFAEDGVLALEYLAAHPETDMVVTDINMPRMDGLTLLARLHEKEDDAPATIIVSAYGDMANIRTAMNRGAFDFLTKPIDFVDLETTISKTLRKLDITREYQRRQQEADRGRAQLARYFSPSLAEQISAGGEATLGAQRREVTALFTDITGFTSLAEQLEPALIEELLNEYLAGTSDVVFAHGGTLLKIIGDALNVVFGAPTGQPDHAARAVACAMALDEYAEAFRKRWREKNVEFGATRIGVHSGPALVGNFGSGRYFDYTAYGDTINTAQRLEAANKQLGTRICVSHAVVDQIPNFQGRPVGDLILRGRHEALPAHEPLAETNFTNDLTAAYSDAFTKAAGNDPGALPAFAALLGRAGEDRLVSFHLKRLLDGAQGIRIALD